MWKCAGVHSAYEENIILKEFLYFNVQLLLYNTIVSHSISVPVICFADGRNVSIKGHVQKETALQTHFIKSLPLHETIYIRNFPS